jgi:hypothetical protein
LELRRFRSGRRPGCHHPKAWLADVPARIADLPVFRLHELLAWEWKAIKAAAIAVAA